MTAGSPGRPRSVAARIAVRRGEFVQLRKRLLATTWLWSVAFVVVGALLVMPGRSNRIPVLTAGEVAPTDVVVDRDVVLPDAESTEAKRHRASLEVLPVYLFDPGAGAALNEKLDRLFQEGRHLLLIPSEDLARRLGEASGLVLKPREAEALHTARFNAKLLAALHDIVDRLYRQGIVADRPELLHAADRGITLRLAGSNEERTELDVYRFLDGGPALAETVEQRLSAEPAVSHGARPQIVSFLTRALTPNVTLDRAETLARRLKAAGGVEEVSIRLPRGRVLVRRGDEVTPQTARLLAALAERGSSSQTVLPLLGAMLLCGLLAAGWVFFLRHQSPSPEEARARFGGLVLLTLVTLLLERGFLFLAGAVAGSVMRDPFGHVELYLPALPHGAGPIIASLMFGLPVGVLFAVVQSALVAMMVGGGASVGVFALVAGVAASFASQRLKERYVLARVGALVAGVNALAVLGLVVSHGRVESGPVVAAQVIAGAAGGVLAAALASFLLPVLEAATGTITDIRLLELSNPNLPLLRRLSLEAPGTFQHSLAMANLAEAAAEAIGANPLLARVCCYYHDIGKLTKPEYFVENQRGQNPHDNLTPWMSALVVSNHVKAGLELARQYKLPEAIRDSITTHHGTKLIRYFYSRAKEQADPDRGEVQETEFRYPGPRPRSKEMGILLLSDAVEAASRTVQEATPGRIQSMIDQVVKNVLEDGQLDECDLTLKDIEKAGAAFFWVLTNVFHNRIDYPGFDFNRRRHG
jgi:putative nucleotidyltransferase with HDIG domain